MTRDPCFLPTAVTSELEQGHAAAEEVDLVSHSSSEEAAGSAGATDSADDAGGEDADNSTAGSDWDSETEKEEAAMEEEEEAEADDNARPRREAAKRLLRAWQRCELRGW